MTTLATRKIEQSSAPLRWIRIWPWCLRALSYMQIRTRETSERRLMAASALWIGAWYGYRVRTTANNSHLFSQLHSFTHLSTYSPIYTFIISFIYLLAHPFTHLFAPWNRSHRFLQTCNWPLSTTFRTLSAKTTLRWDKSFTHISTWLLFMFNGLTQSWRNTRAVGDVWCAIRYVCNVIGWSMLHNLWYAKCHSWCTSYAIYNVRVKHAKHYTYCLSFRYQTT